MTKKELIGTVAQSTGLSKKDVETVFKSIFETIKNSLSEGGEGARIAIKGFGTFSVKRRAARTGRHPATKELLEIPERTVPFFSAGTELKAAVATPTISEPVLADDSVAETSDLRCLCRTWKSFMDR